MNVLFDKIRKMKKRENVAYVDNGQGTLNKNNMIIIIYASGKK